LASYAVAKTAENWGFCPTLLAAKVLKSQMLGSFLYRLFYL